MSSVIISLFFLVNHIYCGRYLIWLPLSSRSVKIGVMEVGEELARRGHEVTVISPHKYKAVPPGVREIVHESGFEALTTATTEDMLSNENAGLPFVKIIDVGVDGARSALLHPDTQNIIKNEEVDVVISLPVFANEVGSFIAYKKNATLVPFMTAGYGFPNINWGMGDPYNPSYMPSPLTGYSQTMNFGQRLINTGAVLAYILLRRFNAVPKIHAMLGEVFPGEEIPDLDDLIKNSALFINHGTPFTGDGLRPVMPKTILAGLMSCRPAKPLPGDLEKFIRESEHGVIFVSFGSVVKASKMPEAKRKMMLAVFSRLKQRVIWKWETSMEDAPDNVMLSSWLPQTSLLAHPGVKLFITHGGAGSIQETICHKTPIIGVPIFGDQPVNVKEAVNKKLGLQMDWHKMTEDSLLAAITEVLEDPEYQRSVSRLSELIMDQPQHPLERAVWWLEYLLRHPHNPGMRPVTHNLSWPQYFLLDVIATVVAILGVVIMIFIGLIRYCCCRKARIGKQKSE